MEFINLTQAKKQTKLSYLGNINSSAKIIKNKKVSNNYTYILYLAPADKSGHNVCLFATDECKAGCLSTSGRAAMDLKSGKNIIENARINKTKLFHEHNEFFMKWMIAEMKSFKEKAKRDNYDFSVRLNGTSDIDWTNVFLNGKNIFQIFPDVQFYDYTKNPTMFMRELPNNYHLTFSYTGKNNYIAYKLLDKGFNIAMIFNIDKNESLPETFNGYPVVNGDLTDYRPNDGKGVIVGLRWKKIANDVINQQVKNSIFVIQKDEIQKDQKIKKVS